MSIDKDKITEFAEKAGEAITETIKAGAKYTKEKAPLVGNACVKFGRELKDIFTSKSNSEIVEVDVMPSDENNEPDAKTQE